MDISVNERKERAMAFFREGYNCSQSVVLAFSDIIGLDEKELSRLSCGLGGGVGRMREVCGTVTGMAMVAGYISDKGGHAPEESGNSGSGAYAASQAALHHTQKHACYALVQELSDKFKADNGSIVCRELLGLRTAQKQDPEPAERNGHYYKVRPCEQLVGYAAALLAERLSRTNP